MAAEIRVFIKFDDNLSKHVQSVNSVRKAYDGLSKSAIDSNGRITKSHEAAAKAGVRAFDMYKAGALASVKTVEEYRQEWAGKSTKKLIAYEKELADKRVDLTTKVKIANAEADSVHIRSYSNELLQISRVQAALKQVSIERKGVLTGGAGTIIGQLGIGRNLSGIGPLSGLTSGLSALGPAGAVAGAGLATFGAAAAFAIKQGADMETTLASLSAQSGMTGGDLDNLRKKAEEFSKKFHVDAGDAVNSFRVTINALGLDLAKNTPLLNSMTENVMTLAKASGLSAEEAGGAMGTAFNMFGGKITDADAGSKFANIMNVLAAGARQARTQIPDLVGELAKFGPVAHQAGLSIEESVAAMEALGHAGIDVGESGNQFKAYIMEISAGSKAGKDALAKLGLTYYDINPNVVGLSKSIHTLKGALDAVYDPETKVGDAVKRSSIEHEIFQRRSSALAEALMQNVDTFDTYTKAVTGTNTATEMAAAHTKTFNDQMSGLWDEVKNVGTDAFFKYKKQIDEIPEALEKIIPVAVQVVGGIEKTGAAIYDIVKYINSLHTASTDLGVGIGSFLRNAANSLGGKDPMAAYSLFTMTDYSSLEQSDNAPVSSQYAKSVVSFDGKQPTPGSGYKGATSGSDDEKKKKAKGERTNIAPELPQIRDYYKSKSDISKSADDQISEDNRLSQQRELNAYAESGATEKQITAEAYSVKKDYLEKEQADLSDQLEYLRGLSAEEVSARGDTAEEISAIQKRLRDSQEKFEQLLHEQTMSGLKDRTDAQTKYESITKELHAKETSLIADKYKRESQEAIDYYTEERARIDKDIKDTKQHEEAIILLNTETSNRLKAIDDDKAKSEEKSVKNYSKVTDILKEINGLQKDNVSTAKEWGLVVGAVAAALIERIPDGGSDAKKTTPILGSYKDGTDYVPATGAYFLHEGESVVSKPHVPYLGKLNTTESSKAERYRKQGIHHEKGLEDAGLLDPLNYVTGGYEAAAHGIEHGAAAGLLHFVKGAIKEESTKSVFDTLTEKEGHGAVNFAALSKLQFGSMPSESTRVRGYENGGEVDPNTVWQLVNGKDPLGATGDTKGVQGKQVKDALNSLMPDVIGALTYKSPPDQYNWNGSKKPQPKHSEALGLLGKLAPIAANLLVPGSGAIVGPLLDSLGVNATESRHSLLSSSGFAGLSGSGMAVAGGALSFLGLDSGGYTGWGGKKEPAGIVHKGEFVFSADAVNKIGVGNLDSWHRAARGYESGGYVSNFYPYRTPPVHHSNESAQLTPHFERLTKAVENIRLNITSGDMQAYNNIGTQQIGLISG